MTCTSIAFVFYCADGQAYFSEIIFSPRVPKSPSSHTLTNYVTYQKMSIEVYQSLRFDADSYVPAFVMVGSFVLYWFFLVPVLFPLTRPRTERSKMICLCLRDAHNAVMCVYWLVACATTLLFLQERGELSWFSSSTAASTFLCEPSFEGTPMMALFWTFAASKVVEWLDTAFLIWVGGRAPKFIHVYHHATTFWIILLTANFPGTRKSGMLFNGAVHTMMYSHYFRRWPKYLVPVITASQLMQLLVVMWSWQAIPGFCGGSYASFAKTNVLLYLTPF